MPNRSGSLITQPGPAALARRYGALTADNVSCLDAASVRYGGGVAPLMELAGWQVARCAWRLLARRPAMVLVVAGSGNNGGDALVAARHLASWGCIVRGLTLVGSRPMGELLAGHARNAIAAGAVVSELGTGFDASRLAASAAAAALVIDGLIGTGLSAAPRPAAAIAIAALARSRVLAVDVPSGLDATRGVCPGACVRAVATCTLAGVKQGLWQPAGRDHSGVVYVADIGIPRMAWRTCGLTPPSAIRGGALLRVPLRSP